ncbi:MAG: hypothetical protein WAT36_06465 [Chromatiaceae bacterium]
MVFEPQMLNHGDLGQMEMFFQYQPTCPLHEIDAELAEVEKRILALLREVTE